MIVEGFQVSAELSGYQPRLYILRVKSSQGIPNLNVVGISLQAEIFLSPTSPTDVSKQLVSKRAFFAAL